MGWKITIDGTIRTNATVKKITDEFNDHIEALVILPNTSAYRSLISTDVDILIEWDDTTLFEGLITGALYGDKLLECYCYHEAFANMSKKSITGEYAVVAASTILGDICTAAGVTAGSCPATAVSIQYTKAICWNAALFLALAVNKDFWLDYSGGSPRFNIGDKGSAKGELTSITIPKRGLDRIKKRDKIWVKGHDTNGQVIWGEAGTGSDETMIVNRQATDETTLDNIAAKKLEELNTDTAGTKIKDSIGDIYNVFSGDTVTINKSKLNLSGSYKVWKITKKLTEGTLELERISDAIDRELRKTQTLEELGIYPVPASGQFNLVPNPSFEQDESGDGLPDHWKFVQDTGTPTGSRVTGGYEGNYCVQSSNSPSQRGDWITKGFVAVVEGKYYIHRARYKELSGTLQKMNLALHWYNASKVYMSTNFIEYTDMDTTWREGIISAKAPPLARFCKLGLETYTTTGQTGIGQWDAAWFNRKFGWEDVNIRDLNMLLNPSFEDDEDGDGVPDFWSFMGDGTKSIVTGGAEGKYCVKVVLAATEYGGWRSNFIAVEDVHKYLLRFKHMASASASVLIKVGVTEYDADKVKIADRWNQYSAVTSWAEKTWLYTPSGSTVKYAKVLLFYANNSGGSIDGYFDSVWFFKQISWEEIFDPENAMAPMIKRWEAEDAETINGTIISDSAASGGQAVRALSTDPNRAPLARTAFQALPAGEYYFIYRIKVSSIASSSNVFHLIVEREGPTWIEDVWIKPNDFPTANKYRTFAIRVEVQNDWKVRASLDTNQNGICNVWEDWVACIPTSVPIAAADVTILTEDPGSTGDNVDPGAAGDNVDPAAVNAGGFMPKTEVLGLAMGSFIEVDSSWTTIRSGNASNVPANKINFLTVYVSVLKNAEDEWGNVAIRLQVNGYTRMIVSAFFSNTLNNYVYYWVIPVTVANGNPIVLSARKDGGGNVDLSAWMYVDQYQEHTHTITGDSHTTPISGDAHTTPISGDAHAHSDTEAGHTH